jgi:putative transposase
MYEYRKLSPDERARLVFERLAHGRPPHSPPHFAQNQTVYLLTAACYEHASHLASPKRREYVLDLLFEGFINAGMEILAWVVLPNHYHLLIHVTEFRRLGPILRKAHGRTSREWNLEDEALGRKVWFRFADRAMRSMRHYYTTLNYIHYNPVKHNYSTSPYDWKETSVHWYLEHMGRAWLRDLWTRYPLKDYGKGWDDLRA